ncbi:hypothetical protein BGX34_001232, partial [Mortierella sp. NVP85]
ALCNKIDCHCICMHTVPCVRHSCVLADPAHLLLHPVHHYDEAPDPTHDQVPLHSIQHWQEGIWQGWQQLQV